MKSWQLISRNHDNYIVFQVIHLNYDLKHWFIAWFRWMTGITMLIMPWLLIFMSWFRWLTVITTLMTSWQVITQNHENFIVIPVIHLNYDIEHWLYRDSGHSPKLRCIWCRDSYLIFISWFRWIEIVTANLAKSRELCRNSGHSPELRYW